MGKGMEMEMTPKDRQVTAMASLGTALIGRVFMKGFAFYIYTYAVDTCLSSNKKL